jgi:sec-independent protein translocase protein TatA
MFGLGFGELLIIAVVLFLLFGAKKIPEFGKGLGEGIKNFKKAISESHSDVKVTPKEIPEDKPVEKK